MSPAEHILRVSDVSIQFGGVRALADVSFHVEQGQVFSIGSGDQPGQSGDRGQQPQESQPQPAQSEPQQAEPQTIQLGMTTDQVQSSLGKPEKIFNVGSKQIYVYKDVKVTFLNGKVSDVQ